MKFSIAKKELVSVLNQLQSIFGHRNSKGVHAHVKLHVEDDTLTASAICPDGISMVVTEKSESIRTITPGEICVQGHRLLSIAKVLIEGNNIIQVEQNTTGAAPQVTIISENNKKSIFKIVECQRAEEFPPMHEMNALSELSLQTNDVKRIIKETVLAIGNRPNLNGIYMEVVQDNEDSFLRLVSSDGNRLSWSEAKIESGSLEPDMKKILQKSLISEQSIREIQKCCEQDDNIKFSFGDNGFSIQTQNVIMNSSFLAGSFPEYRGLLNKMILPNVAKIDRNATLDVCRRVVAVTGGKDNNSLHMKFSDAKVDFTLGRTTDSLFQDQLQIDYIGKEIGFTLKSTYFEQTLKELDSDQILVHLGDNENSACKITIPDDTHCEFIIMPIKLS